MKELIQAKVNEEFLRFIFLEGFGYEVKEMAQMLQTSPSTIKNLKTDLLKKESEVLPLENETSTFGLVDQRFKRSDNYLRYFFMNLRESKGVNSIKKFERCYAILMMLKTQPATYSEVQEMLYDLDPEESRAATYLGWLEQEGLIELKSRYYHLVSFPLLQFEKGLVYRLLLFTFERMNQNPLSYHGEQIFEGIWDFISRDELIQCIDLPLIAHGSNFLRILDEYKVQLLQQAIQEQRLIEHVYFKRTDQRVVKQKELEEMKGKVFIPLKLVYDHTYGRWYVIGRDNRKKAVKEDISFTVKKVDLISHLQVIDETMDKDVLTAFDEKLNAKLANSWLVSQSNSLQRVRLKFSGEDAKIVARLQREKRWGTLEKLEDGQWLYSIDVRDYTEMRPWIRSFSHNVQVLEPLALIEEMTKELEARLARCNNV